MHMTIPLAPVWNLNRGYDDRGSVYLFDIDICACCGEEAYRQPRRCAGCGKFEIVYDEFRLIILPPDRLGGCKISNGQIIDDPHSSGVFCVECAKLATRLCNRFAEYLENRRLIRQIEEACNGIEHQNDRATARI